MTNVTFLEVLSDQVESISAKLWELGGVSGMEESPSLEQSTFLPEGRFEVLEFGTKAARECEKWLQQDAYRQQKPMILKIYHENEIQNFHKKIKVVLEAYDFKILKGQEVAEQDYVALYKESVKGLLVHPTLWVGPSWAKPPKDKAIEKIFVDPALAFGTGDHPTTGMCLERIHQWGENYPTQKPFECMDLGAGTGVLGLYFKRLFPKAHVCLVDTDPQCELECSKTWKLNSYTLQDFQGVFGQELYRQELWGYQANSVDFLISNIYAEVLSHLLPSIQSVLKDGGLWLATGILGEARKDELLNDARELGLHLNFQNSSPIQETQADSSSEKWYLIECQKG